MTTPQSMLHDMHYKINQLIRSFEAKEGEEDLFEQVKTIHGATLECIERINKLENTMSLIIKLLSQTMDKKKNG